MPTPTTQIPEELREVLPAHAERIFDKAFAVAWKEYTSAKDGGPQGSREEVAYERAWSAVRQAGYHKNPQTGRWERQFSDGKKA